MKKRVLSLVLAFVLSFSMMPMSAFAEETGTVTEQETQKGENSAEVSTTGEDISGGNAVTKDAAVEAAQALIDALPEEVTAENADELQTQLMAIAEAMEALNDEQTAKLNMTRLENIQAALNGAVAVQATTHTDHIGEGETMTEWSDKNKLPDAPGNYYLSNYVTLTKTWEPANDTVLCLNGYSITMNANTDEVIKINDGVTFTLCSCKRGGVSHGTGYTGRGVTVNGGKFIMSGGFISNNNTTQNGGGVYVDGGGTFEMTGGNEEIDGLYVGSLIQGNKANYNGGGVYVNNGTFTMTGNSTVNSNKAGEKGGGVYVNSVRGTFNMTGGSIRFNTADYGYGGGVYMNNGTFNMTGGEVYYNSARYNGGGVYVSSDAVVTVAGNVKINEENKDTNKESNNVYLDTSDGTSATITVTGKLGDDAKIGVTTKSKPTEENPVTFATAGAGYTLTAGDADHFSSDANYYPLLMDNEVKLYRTKPHMHFICGADATCNHTGEPHSETLNWKGISDLTEITENGNYYLKDNVTLESTWYCTVAGVKLCLNGHTITGAYGSPVIQVSKRGSLDITDCKTEAGQITHESEVSGRGIKVQGTLTLWNGDITGNIDGGVYVKSGTFTMNSGSITGNMSSSYGGVYVDAGATFNMNGGTINGNNCKKSDGSGGGVYVNSSAKFTVSGAAKIINNWRSGELANNVYVQGNGTKGNVFLYSDATITVGEEGLTDEARIGVCKSQISLPKAGKTVKIATGASGSLKYTEIFALDIDDPNYSIVSDDGGNLFIHLHKHSWSYKVSDDVTITATCGAENCLTKDGGSVSISKPEHTTYGDGKKADATLVENGWVADTVTITYKDKDDVVLEGAPTDAGEYTASITLGDATASVTYEIEKATPSANDFTFTAPSPTYSGEPKEAKVAANKEGMGTIVAVTYYRDGIVVEKPTDAGTYTFKISVGEGEKYKAASGLENPDWEFTIECNKNMPIVKFNDGTTYTYTGEQIQPTVTVTVGGKELENGKDYTVTYDGNVNVGDGTVIITAKGNYAFAKDTEHFTIVQAKQTLNFEKDAVNTTYGDAPFTNALAKTSTYFGTITYSSDNTAVATVDGSTGQVTIVGVGTASITATAAATTNYKEGSASYTLTVNKALLVVNGAPVVQDKYYDGTADAVVTVSFADGNNALLKLKPTTDYTVTGTFSSPNASTSKQEVSIKIELKGDYAKNYELKKATYTAYANIHAKPISIVSATAVGREYEKGNTSVTIDSVDFDGVVTAAPLVKGTDYTATGEMDDANAGTNKEVTVKVTLSGDAATNYNLSGTMPTTTVDISQATAEIAGATTQRIMKNGVEVDISKWVSFNNTDSKAELEYELLYSPEGITLNGSKLTVANNDTTVESFAIKVTAKETPNFTSAEKTITVDVVDKMRVGIIFKEPVKSNTVYGDPDFSLTADFDPDGTVPAEGDNGTWEWKSSNPDVLKIISGGDTTTPTIKVLKAGRSFLTVTYTSDTYSGGPNGVSITVNPKAITADMIGNIDAQEYTGKDIKPTPEVTDGTTKLISGKDFTYSYANNRNAGTATLTITGKGNYEGEVTKEFTISPKSIDGASIELANKSFAYTGSEQTVNITSVKLSDGTILGTDDYVIKDNSNKATNAGEITLTIEGKGNYTGTATTTWAITKAAPKLADFDVVPDLSNELTYSGEEQIVNVTTKAGIRGMGMITVRYNDSTEKPVNVGSYAITIDVADGSNYKAISGIEAGTLTIKKAAAPTLADVKVDHAYATTGNQTVSLAELVKSAKSYATGEITGNTETEILSDINVTGDGVLQYTLTGKGAAGSTVTIPVAIISTNYEETTVNVVITIKQATPTGAPGYDFVHDSSKTLKDAGLDLINSTLNPKEGTLEWIDSNGKVLPGETKLEEGKKYIWRFTPDDPNYAVITGEVELYAPYRILDGADSTWTQSTDGTIAIRGNGDFEKFQSVKVDGVVVDTKNYTVAKGSTIITFKEDYLKTLSTGSHTFELVWTDGSATTKFTIAAKADNGDNNNSDNNNNDKNDDSDNDTVVIGNVSSGNNTVPAVIGAPKTGDASGIWMTLFAVSLAGLAAMLVRKKNNRE